MAIQFSAGLFNDTFLYGQRLYLQQTGHIASFLRIRRIDAAKANS